MVRAHTAESPAGAVFFPVAYEIYRQARPLVLPVLLAAGLLLSAVNVSAQTASTSPTPAQADPAVRMNPFVVSEATDVGYIATRASGATKINTPMIELPHSIEVLNKEFIADTSSTTVFQASRYVSNVAGGSQRGDDGLLIRGFAVTRLRNGQPYAQGNVR